MSALFSREAANAIVRSEKVREHLEFIKRLDVPDEKLWGSILGNSKGSLRTVWQTCVNL